MRRGYSPGAPIGAQARTQGMEDDTRHDHDDDTQTGKDASGSADKLPAQPADDGTPLGDTDQHSYSDA
jgi:hypothetical protein